MVVCFRPARTSGVAGGFGRPARWHANGYLGKVHTIRVGVPGGTAYAAEPPCDPPEGFDYDMWTGPAPMIPFDKRRCEWLAMYMVSHYCAGFITNWGVHHLDIAGWGCPEIFNKPFEVEGKGVLPERGMTDTWIAWQMEYRYASGLKMSFSDTDHPNRIGCRFEGDQGWVHVGREGIWAEPRSLLTVRMKPDDAPPPPKPPLRRLVRPHRPLRRLPAECPDAARPDCARRGRPRGKHAGQRRRHRVAFGPQA